MGIKLQDASALFMKLNKFVAQSPKIMRGSWASEMPEILSRFDLYNEGAFMTVRCPSGKIIHEVPCLFRDRGLFDGDGQNDLRQRVSRKPLCW